MSENKMKVHYMSDKHTWETPQEFFDLLNEEFNFEIDLACEKETAKCDKYYTKENDGLDKVWNKVSWLNPPYGNSIGSWVQKAYLSAKFDGGTIVCLIPSRTDTKWWHDYVMKAKEIRFVKGRLKFGGLKSSAPFPSAVVVFQGNTDNDTPKISVQQRYK